MKRLIESGVCVNSQDGVSRLSDCTCTCIASGADPGIGSGGGGGTGEGVAGGGAKLDAEPPRGGCGRGAPLPPS